MNQQRLMKVILAPVVSEKSNLLAEKRNQMTFRVLPDATKAEVKAAVELLFGVQVALLLPMRCLLVNITRHWFTSWLLLSWQMPVLATVHS